MVVSVIEELKYVDNFWCTIVVCMSLNGVEGHKNQQIKFVSHTLVIVSGILLTEASQHRVSNICHNIQPADIFIQIFLALKPRLNNTKKALLNRQRNNPRLKEKSVLHLYLVFLIYEAYLNRRE